MKTCKKCLESKPLDAFHVRLDGRDGRRSRCRQCMARYTTEYRAIHGRKYASRRKKPVLTVTCPSCNSERVVRCALDDILDKRCKVCVRIERPPKIKTPKKVKPEMKVMMPCANCGDIRLVGRRAGAEKRTCKKCSSKAPKYRPVTHGMSASRAYRIWAGMRDRCTNPNNGRYSDYGGRGIKVNEKWMKFEGFYADMGNPPSSKHSLDRFPNRDGNYTKDNCRWATAKEQQNNTRINVRITVSGVTRTAAEWASITGLETGTIRTRYQRGWDSARILTPVKKSFKRIR